MNNSVFEQILGKKFKELHPILKIHYNLHEPGEMRVFEGRMDEIKVSKVALILRPAFKLLNAFTPIPGKNIKTLLKNSVCVKDSSMLWNRTFYYDRRIIDFNTKMICNSPGFVTEYVGMGLGIVMQVDIRDSKLRFESTHYHWNLRFFRIPIPHFLSPGKAVINEFAIDSNTLAVDFQVKHPLFGKMFGYKGTFNYVKMA